MGLLLKISMLLLATTTGFGLTQASAASEALAALPSCALSCLAVAIQASPCSPIDTACQCTNVELVSSAEVCIAGSCAIEDALVAKNATQTMCGAPVRDKSAGSNIVSIAMMSIALVVVLIRLVFKKLTSSELGLDDWSILSTIIVGIPSAVLNVVGLTANGLGRDIWTLTPSMITRFAMSFYIVSILYFAEVFILKLSLLFFYIRIFPGPGIRRLLWGTVVFDILFGIAFILVAIFQCTPIKYNWTNWTGEGGGTCVNINAIAWANAGISIALDLWMLALPLSQLRDLKMHWKKKIGVALMFCVGTFVTVVSAIRVISLVQFRASSNLSWDYWSISIWSSVEITVGIICACMPSMRVILVRMAPKIFGSGSRSFRSGYYKNGDSVNRSNGKGQINFSRKHASWKQISGKKPTISSTTHSGGMDSPVEALFPDGISDVELVRNKGQFTPFEGSARRDRAGAQITVSTQISVRSHEPPITSPYDENQRGRSWSREL